ncbi:MAG: hypothetical protein PHT96_13420 [Syntrophorhabdaceae bacterium]|nr:hypothetical protein [Eubacteriales bacterium]MDD4197383.1 hypothetical protein [Syntrophorhabdaceae bacterium]
MKRFLFVFIAALLAIPALGHAGSVSSRHDVTFGGLVKYDLGYSAQNSHADPSKAFRQSTSDRAILEDEYGNTFASGAETRFNFLIKGPELLGARTKAFIEGDFRGTTTGNAYGGFQLRHAFMNLNWESAELMIGQNWQQWGMPYYRAQVGADDFKQYLKGIRTPQVAFRYFFTKEFNAMIGLTSATGWSGTTRQYNDGYARSSWPGLQGEIAYWTDRCGKIGPNNLKFALGGYYGRDSETFTDPVNPARIKDSSTDAWVAAFRYSLPIVPEKQGNKAMSVLLNGNFFIGQNVAGNNWMGTSGPSNGAYMRSSTEAAAPTLFGMFAQVSWWITDKLWMNGLYGYLKYNYSEWARSHNAAARDTVNMSQSYAVNMYWDANQAIRFGLQWMRIFTHYNGVGPGNGPGFAGTSGTMDQYRLAAWYFF